MRKRLLTNLFNAATQNIDKEADKLRIRIYIVICLIGIFLPVLALMVLASFSLLHPFSIIFGVACTSLYSFFLYLCLIDRHKISGTLASFAALVFPIAAVVIFGSEFDYDLVILVLAISPFIYPQSKKAYPFVFLILHTLAFLVCDNLTISPIIEFDPDVIGLTNRLISWFIAILIVYEASAFFVLHHAGITEMAEREKKLSKPKKERKRMIV
ncbi:MAG: hypothetical protein AAFO82_16310 [Bacteroidota bacterium]